MRNFDLWNRYQDNSYNPLRGCVEFMVRDGNTPAPIYDSDEVALDNPQITDIYGRTEHQVFVDTDVIAYFYKYIGNGTIESEQAIGIDTSDVTKWSLQYTSESMMKVHLDIEADAAITTPDLASLRLIDPEQVPVVSGKKYVWLYGYNQSGDCAPVLYYWNSTSVANDDGGSVIQGSELTGRWIMVPPEVHLDVRHFGVFPSSSRNDISNQRAGISNAVAYANRVGLRVWFPMHETTTGNTLEYKYYRYDNLYAYFENGLDVDQGVIFLDGGTGSTFRFDDIRGDLYFDAANTSVITNFAKASWNIKSMAKINQYQPAKYIIDDMNHSTAVRTLQNYYVECTAYPIHGFTFNDCRISETGKLGHNGDSYNLFINCKLTGKMFHTADDDYQGDVIGKCTNCTMDIMDFQDGAQYLYYHWRCTDNYDANFDYQNMPGFVRPYDSFVGNTITSSVVRVINFRRAFSSKTLLRKFNNIDTIILENCEGYFDLPKNVNVQILNSNVKLSIQTANVLTCTDSTVYLDGDLPEGAYPSMSFRNCTVVVEDSSIYYMVSSLTLYSSIVMANFTPVNVVAKDNQLNGNMRLVFDDSISNVGFFDNNIVNGQMYVLGKTGSVNHVRCTWTNNSSALENPITIDRTNLDPIDSSHAYVYQGNTGTFLPREVSKKVSKTIQFISTIPSTIATQCLDDYMYANTPSGDSWSLMSLITDNLYDDQNNYENGISGLFNIFSIGTDDFTCSVDWRVTAMNSAGVDYTGVDEFFQPMRFTMIARFVLGYGWKLIMRRQAYTSSAVRTSSTVTGIWRRGGSPQGSTITADFIFSRNP